MLDPPTESAILAFEELVEHVLRDAPLGADFFAFEFAGFEGGEDVGFGDAELLGDLRGIQHLRACRGCGY